jgi:phosphatidate cytidylyltransferase
MSARREPRKKGTSDLLPRVLVAIPAVAFAVTIIYFGEWVFAAGIGALAVACVHELCEMFKRARPVRLAAMLAVLGLTVAGTAGDERQVLLALALSLPLTFFIALLAPTRERITASIAVTMLIIVWIGLGVAFAAMLRGLEHGGALVVMVLLGTFFGDTFAYLGGRLLGRRKLAPRISPNKTVEGLLCGIVLGTLIVWYWSRTYDGDWISGTDGLLLGLAVVIAAPVGDLFESLIKRDMGTKDTGTLFGPHGGALDRVDAALFALAAGYFVWLAVA